MRKEPLRVGFLGASTVAHKAWLAIHRAGHRVTCIGCRDASKGQELAERLKKDIEVYNKTKKAADAGAQQPFAAPSIGSYMDVVRADNVDVVYISLPTSKRPAWIRVCAEHGKHVVSEKPAATSAAELVECLRDMASNRLLFMDGTALSHSQRLQDVCRAVAQLGGPVHINAHMSFPASPTFMVSDIRLQPLLEPYGALGDLGWYCIRWILHIVDFVLPTGVGGRVTECDGLWDKEEASNGAATGTTTSARLAGAPAVTVVAASERRQPKRPVPAAITGFEGDLEFTIPAPTSSDVAPAAAAEAAATVTASFRCGFHDCHDQTVDIFCRDGTVTVLGAINPTAEDRPRFLTQRHKVAAAAATAAPEQSSAADATEAFQVYERLEEINDVVYSTTPAETDGAQQMEQLWRDVGDSLMRLGKGEPLIADPDLAKKWSTFAYVTQVVMDRALEAAGQHAPAVTTSSADT
ncbi:oxidoreductase-like protein [Leishmania donovani]|uniref:Oxidoreductase-like_protein n=3 Tax=Leishmania donovani species complex TaxID=38574 RepID=A0A6L0XPR9_LEIIN|nr:oxidoreductase-like protein [Leishmania infantum JPCM5]TPP51367.1 Oxidoreductase family, NAD-binding Rossmann fold protein [Leishmania donovani]CAC9489314.1 oxidoreductase-like_protein [Leishmania infantum]CAJ1988937.1 oxidoreductase-like protein [Leishmania donovani]CAM68164.1 oxidoreductase-like protein [Leishmania infantum JPCM5]SUZ41935.1 oxidoreductase-like_protein [Leishmania infantum]|eukprot:XP_001465738.1 oxidoreductase-like protein [Leishmania infantum JPCM5]